MVNISLKQVEEFHKKREFIPKVIERVTDEHETVYGATAINKQVPKFLRVPTNDVDIYTKTPKIDAREVEKALDKRFKGNHFYIQKAQHPGTYRVNAYADKNTYADYTKPEGEIPRKKIGRIYYTPLSHIKQMINKTLKDKTSAYRHDKDRATLKRIKVAELRKVKLRSKTKKTMRSFW